MSKIATTTYEYVCNYCKKPFKIGEEFVFTQYGKVATDVGGLGHFLEFDDDNKHYDYHIRCFHNGIRDEIEQ